jgi:hypothetical protein
MRQVSLWDGGFDSSRETSEMAKKFLTTHMCLIGDDSWAGLQPAGLDTRKRPVGRLFP